MASSPQDVSGDVLVIGAGMGGLRIIHELRKLGLSIHGVEAGSDVGGTWYWNTYPGARTDTEAWGYGFFFDEALASEWVWSERYPSQSQMLDYLEYVATRFDLRKAFQFNQFVRSARFDSANNKWIVETDKGMRFSVTYLVTACGVLSSPVMPSIPGLQQYNGQAIHSARWPQEGVSFAGKRVAIIGAGATGVQLLPVVSQVAEHVTMFQRTPNYVIPARNNPLVEYDRDKLRARYGVMREQIRNHVFASTFDPNPNSFLDLSEEEREKVLEAKWEWGGFQFVFETFNDFFTNSECNRALADFICRKIRLIVNDPETAEILCPKYPLFSKRPPLGHGYFEAYNRENVSLVDISQNGIETFTADGIRAGGVEYPFDIVIFATGFDAGTGALTDIDITGLDGVSLRKKWSDGPVSYLGMCVDEFPNMFMIAGPQGPLSVIPPAIEAECVWIAQVLAKAQSQGSDRIEVRPDAARAWKAAVDNSSVGTVIEDASSVRSWYMGANVEGKAHVMQFYVGGYKDFADRLDSSAGASFPELEFSTAHKDQTIEPTKQPADKVAAK